MLWSALDLYGQTVQWMEWIVNLDFGRFRTQGILGVGAITRTFIASSPAAESPRFGGGCDGLISAFAGA